MIQFREKGDLGLQPREVQNQSDRLQVEGELGGHKTQANNGAVFLLP
jgi:hypothetical protein